MARPVLAGRTGSVQERSGEAMNRVISIAPVRKTVVVHTTPAKAFEVFTARIDRWWPKSHGIGSTPVRESIIEPFVGGRWYTKCEDGTEVVVGHVRVWEPAERFVVSWEISADWKPDARAAFRIRGRSAICARDGRKHASGARASEFRADGCGRRRNDAQECGRRLAGAARVIRGRDHCRSTGVTRRGTSRSALVADSPMALLSERRRHRRRTLSPECLPRSSRIAPVDRG
jgi:hypothetical protein